MKRVITITLSFDILDDVQRLSESFQEGRWNGGILYMKKRWGTPMAMVEEFEANEYVAACYSVVCNVDAANDVERNWPVWVPGNRPWESGNWSNNYDAGQTHSSTACGALGNYYVIDNNNDGRFDGMIEISRDQGQLPCTIYTGADYSTTASWGGIASGQTIYWTTSSTDGDRTWHHQGVVGTSDPAHPNRS